MKKFWLLLCTLFLIAAQAAQAQKPPIKWDEKPIKGVSKAWLRLFHFYAPRVFPHNTIPPNLWLDASRHAEQMEITHPDRAGNGIGIQSHTGWEFMGPDTTNPGWLARVNSLIVDRTNANNLYIGVAKGGVWKSTDAGTTWTNLTDTITQYVGCLTQDPVNANTIYMGTGEEYFAVNTLGGVGIYVSTDGGATWTLKGNSTFAGTRINAIVIDPTNTNKWIVSCWGWDDARGIYVTTDGGATFTRKLDGIASALRMHPTNPNILYAALGSALFEDSRNGIYKSTDGGNNWTKLAGGLPASSDMGRIELDIHKANPNIVYAAIASHIEPDRGLHSLWKTTDGGTNWTALATPPNLVNRQGWYDLLIRADPVDPNIAYFGMVEAYRTNDGGASWTKLPINHTDMHALEFHPTTPTTLYLGEDGGLYISTDRGANWTAKNTGRGTMEYYAFDVHPTDPNKLAAGAQDNSTHIRTTGNSFNVVIGGDGFWTVYKKSDPTIMLGEAQFGWINRSTNSGVNWSLVLDLDQMEGGRTDWSTPIINDPVTSANFYAASYRVWRSTSSGASGTWSPISGDLTVGGFYTITRMAIAPNNSDVIYTGSGDGSVFVSTNATAASPTWTNRTAGLPTATIGAIAVHPTTASTVYVGLMSYGISHVWKSTNNGQTWTNYSGNLPDTPVSGLVVNPVNPAQLLAATDAGVFLTSDGTTWTRYGEGLPNTPCTHIVANANTGYLTVSTYGRGMWRIALPGANVAPIITSLSPNTKLRGSAAFTLTVNGDHFVTGSKVRWNGADRSTTYGSETQLTASITAADVQTAGTATVTVFNPAPGGGTSNGVTFTITAPNTLPVAGLAGAALTFDGANDSASTPHNDALNPYPLTVSCWLKTTQNNGNRTGIINKYLAGSGDGWQLFLADGKVGAYYFRGFSNYVWDGDSHTFSTPVISDGNWHHVALTIDASGGKFYLDGALVNTQPWTGTPGATTTTQPLGLGNYDALFNGQMDEVKIFNTAHSAALIPFDVNSSLVGNEPGLVAYYRMNEGVGSTSADATGHGYTMTLSGSPAWTASTAPVHTVHALPGQPRPVTLTAFDVDLNALTYTVTANPAKGVLNGTAPNLSYTSSLGYYGADGFTYKVNDGTGDSNIAPVNINYGMPSVNVLGTTTGGPTYNRTNEGEPPTSLSSFATAVPYIVYRLTVPTSGRYSFHLSRITAGYDPFLTLYSGRFDPANPVTNSILANDDKYGNIDISGFDLVMLAAGTEYFVVVSGYDNSEFGDFNLSVYGVGTATITPTRSISGRVIRADCQGIAYTATFTLHPSDNSGDIERIVNVTGTGNFSIPNVGAKNYRVKIKSSNTLSRALNANTTAGDVTGLNFPDLLGGDANNDNLVALEDLAALIQSFDADSSSPNWLNGVADFNSDGLVAVDDLSILIRNFDREGEE